MTLNDVFAAGRNARIDGESATACPHYESSPNGDAWLAGFYFEGQFHDPAVDCLVSLPHRMTVDKVTSGRGYRVNVEGRDMTRTGTPRIKRSIRIEYTAAGHLVTLEG